MSENNKNEIKVFENVGGNYKEVSIDYLYDLELREILNRDIILKLNDCYFCSKNDTIKKYEKANKIAQHFNDVFNIYKSKMIAAGMSDQQNIADYTLNFIKKVLAATTIVGAKIENNIEFDPNEAIQQQIKKDSKLHWPD